MENIKEVVNDFQRLDSLLVYRELLNEPLLQKLRTLVLQLKDVSTLETDTLREQFYQIYAKLVSEAEEKDYTGNIWKSYLLERIIRIENQFTLAVEREGVMTGSSYQLATNDLELLQRVYRVDLERLAQIIELKKELVINQFQPHQNSLKQSWQQKRFKELKDDFNNITESEKLLEKLSQFYNQLGAGELSFYKAFRWEKGSLAGIKGVDPITFKQLIGYQRQQDKLINNTEKFLANKPANNVLLYGARGTGKSSSIKALLNQHFKQGLRLISLNKKQTTELPEILTELKDRGLYFIIFMDDLSFEDFETDYKAMKAIIDGDIIQRPANILFYATSNRRHLIKEKWSDRDEQNGEVHAKDGIEERLSLTSRFGITIAYNSPQEKEYLEIVKELARQYKIDLASDELEEQALQWAMWQNGRSGRTARQFIDYLLGEN